MPMYLLLCSDVLYVNVCISMYHANGQVTVYLPICFLLPSPLCCLCAVSHPALQPSPSRSAESWLQLGFFLLSSIFSPSSAHPSLIPAGLSGPSSHLCPKPGLLFPEVHFWAVKRRHITLFPHLLPSTLPSQKAALSPSLNDHLLPEKTGI